MGDLGTRDGLLLAIYLIGASTAGFVLFGVDKARAKKGRWRIPEKVLLGAALFGGAPGCLAGMYLFRHKTRRWYFRWGIPLTLLLQLAACWAILSFWRRC
ncbi:MAG: DUF1294 domain-containing protein [Oscillospiraceae bacterium]|nr:DUF1294 domain-containing protein [Oscillospiraceae bacterium]